MIYKGVVITGHVMAKYPSEGEKKCKVMYSDGSLMNKFVEVTEATFKKLEIGQEFQLKAEISNYISSKDGQQKSYIKEV